MLHNVLAAAPAMVLCLLLQGVVVAICLRRYARFRRSFKSQDLLWVDVLLLITVMLLTLLCNFAQMAIWAALFTFLGEFSDFATAPYHSAVNFITLGYGDIVMSKQWRMLGPLEAANGILMFGLSTSVMTAAVMDVIKYHHSRLRQESPREHGTWGGEERKIGSVGPGWLLKRPLYSRKRPLMSRQPEQPMWGRLMPFA